MNIISVKDYERYYGDIGLGNSYIDTLVFQRAISESNGRTLGIPAGTYYINETLLYQTDDPEAPGLTLFGEGMRNTTLVDNVIDGPLLRLQGGEGIDGHKQWGGRIADFSIVRGETREIGITSSGIVFRCVWHCDIERIRIQGLGGSGIHVMSHDRTGGGGDADSSAYLRFKNCWFGHNNDFGMRFESSPGTLGISQTSIEGCDITGNALGGIRGVGVGIFTVRGCGIAANGGRGTDCYGGVHVGYTDGANSHHIVIEECEIGNNNLPASIWLETSIVGEISRNRFVKGAADHDRKGVYIGPSILPGHSTDGSVRELACRQNWFGAYHKGKVPSTVPPTRSIVNTIPIDSYTAFDVTGTARNMYIEKTWWSPDFERFSTFLKLNEETPGMVSWDQRPPP
jgi:hypothetical protein